MDFHHEFFQFQKLHHLLNLILKELILSFNCSKLVAPIMLLVKKSLEFTKPNAICTGVKLFSGKAVEFF